VAQKTAPVTKTSNPARVLVIEDDEYFRAIVRDTLARAGHLALEAPNGIVGMTLCKQQPFDVVVVDLVMPEKDGIETIMELKKSFPSMRTIAMSGGGRYANKDEYLRVARCIGAMETLTKPFTDQQLLGAVERVRAGPP
jgi:DNA-binding NtrC family response regulator